MSRRHGIPILVLLSGWLLSTASWATTYYVSTDGKDANTGAQAQPWRTIQRAADAMIAGDETVIEEGVYDEIVRTRADGAKGRPITFQARGSVSASRFHISHDFVTIDGLHFTGYSSGDAGEAAAIFVATTASYGEILNCSFKDQKDGVFGIFFGSSPAYDPALEPSHFRVSGCTFDNRGRYAGHGRPSVFIDIHGGESHLIENNEFRYSCGADALRIHGRGHTIRHNYFTHIEEVSWSHNHADLFQTFGNNGECGSNILIEKNFAYDCGYSYGADCQIGMLAAEVAAGGVPDRFHDWTIRNNVFAFVTAQLNMYLARISIYNNVFYRCTQNTEHVLRMPYEPFKGLADHARVKNNLFIACGANSSDPAQGWYLLDARIKDVVADHNWVAGAGHSSKIGFAESDGVNGGDPKFVHPGGAKAHDYALRAVSPALDRGESLAREGFSDDFDGVVRPQGAAWDIGAFEGSRDGK